MTDVNRGAYDTQEGDRLPWLEAVEDEDLEEGIGSGKLVLGVLLMLLAIGLVIGGVFWLRDRDTAGASGEPGLIAAPAGDYKIPPDQPGGMEVAGKGDAAFAASEGADPNAPIDLSALPEAPVTAENVAAGVRPAAPRPAPPKPAPSAAAKVEDKGEKLAATAKPEAPKPAPSAAPATGAGGAIQLGAFSSEAKANAAWKSLAGRFAFLAPLSPAITPVTTDAGTLYRLRVGAAGQGSSLCARLRVAGESCSVVN